MTPALDARIGQLIDGSYYCFPHGYDQPEVRGSLATVRAALTRSDTGTTPARPRRTYIVTVTPRVIVYTGLHTGGPYQESIQAPTRAAAISIARKRRFDNEGRMAVPATYHARRG